MQTTIRRARPADLPRLNAMQELSARLLSLTDYDAMQIGSYLLYVGTLDEELIHDGTYFVAEVAGRMVGSGGWSTRTPGYARNSMETAWVEHDFQPRIRSLFVHPDWAHRGIASEILALAEAAARMSGFEEIELAATLNSTSFYQRRGYEHSGNLPIALPNGVTFPLMRMRKQLTRPTLAAAA